MMLSLVIPAVPETHPSVLLLEQVACAVACAASVLAVVVLVLLAGHPVPPSAPALQLAWAAVDADPVVPVGVSATASTEDMVIPAWQLAWPPVQAAWPWASDRVVESAPPGLATVAVPEASPVTAPVQPVVGQSSEAEVRAVPVPPGRFFASLSVLAG
jgi:hypothetical protein